MSVVKHIPNALTCGNLLCGCMGLVFALQNEPVPAAWWVWAACVFDFFDGFAARWLNVSSPIGKELDSLADLVSFGVLPALTLFQWIDESGLPAPVAYIALLLAIFSALRLAKFNVDDRQADSFIGLPTPANALFITALPFLPPFLLAFFFQPWALVAISVVFSLLLIAPLPLFALKFKDFSWKHNSLRFTFLLLSVFLIAVWQAGAIPLVILLYISVSLGKQMLASGKKAN
ncbi:MAG: CDP-diacylglycerol--serine O-phosphatidyltransferase [Cyclobacteriaceae bacterium]|jgi:CDP-diacylglycerol--serine O-phosphatidyltransferase|nr:CDP-diacylglycerol--serine O-phosphatidyltransferase [Cyclobacteriaceae bacterium]